LFKIFEMKKVLYTYIALTLIGFNASADGGDTSLPKQTLPDVTLKNTEGENIHIGDYGKNGKITIISFWATWCKPCIKELRNINEVLEDWEEDYNLELVAVSVDDSRNTARVKPFAAGQGWNFEILLDPNGELQRALNVTNPPVTFLVDQDGKIVYTHTGYLEGDELDLEEEIIALVENEAKSEDAPKEEDKPEQPDEQPRATEDKKKGKKKK
jgi:cytochrome c biogenesis protein CcmG/thiol:disulfide interchange protein DsbE